MKKTVLFFACVLAMLTSFSANAAYKAMIFHLSASWGDIDYANNGSGEMRNDIPDVWKLEVAFANNGQLNDWNFEAGAELINETNGMVFKPASYAAAGMMVIMEFNPAVGINGVYSIRFNEGFAKPQTSASGWNDEYTLENCFTIGKADIPDGVEETVVEEEVVAPVYDLVGRTVLESATKAQLNELPAGLYIFNGAKYVVK
ncbi:MAG: hypothetical protein K2M67_04995 [Muribaculaceae bacterium]|nr:hypothetical protein [Muribaculaceae bacterium]